jgi:predicted RNase H-like nuclease (RuvC/YqgF family)
LPSCPNCGTAVATPAKVFTVIVEPKVPTVVSRQHYLVVPDDQMNKIQTDIKNLKKTNQDLEKHIQLMDKEYAELQRSLERSKKDSDTRVLEAKLDALEKHVAYLRKEKGELEKATKLR